MPCGNANRLRRDTRSVPNVLQKITYSLTERNIDEERRSEGKKRQKGAFRKKVLLAAMVPAAFLIAAADIGWGS